MKLGKKVFAALLCLIMVFGSVAVGREGIVEIFDAITVKAKAEENYYAEYPPEGQEYWVVFEEGFRNNRVEMSTFDITGDDSNVYGVWDGNLVAKSDTGAVSRCNQFYYDNGWVYQGDYGILTDKTANIYASNFDIYDKDGNLVVAKSNLFKQSYSVGDTIYYGTYPQSDVTDSLGSVLNSQGGTWKSYGYYSGTGNEYDGKMMASDYMRYKDVTYNGTKYRGVTFDSYRPYVTGYTSSASYTNQVDNGYTTGTIYWFKYEPLEWRVLDSSTGLVMCETIIDSQPSNNFIIRNSYISNDSYSRFGDLAQTYFASDYANSSIRVWLNDEFYNMAFSDEQKSNIKTTTLNNDGYYTLTGISGYEVLDSTSTNDKVFLLSYDEAMNTSYFADNNARQAKGSDYAKCQGLYVYDSSGNSYNGCSDWRLRSPGNYSDTTCFVADGYIYYTCYTDSTAFGIRPALKLQNLKSDTTLPNNPESKIPDNATVFNGHSYKVFDESMTWSEAKEYCESLGGHLVTITSLEEQSFVENIVNNGNKNCYWIGATDEVTEGDYQWITGESWYYTNWSSGNPDNSTQRDANGEDYLELVKSKSYKWNDGENNGDIGDHSLSNHGFICEWDFASRNAPYWGDLNGDCKVTFSDMLIYNKIRLGKIVPSQEQRCFMDVDLDGSIEKEVKLSDLNPDNTKGITELENPRDSIPDDMLLMNKLRLNKIDSLPADKNANIEFISPTKTTYAIGEDFDPSGMKIVISNKEDPSIKYELTKNIDVPDFDPYIEGVQTLTAEYRGLIFNFSVTVGSSEGAVNHLKLKTVYDGDVYWSGDGFYGENVGVSDSVEFHVELKNQPGYIRPDGTGENKPISPVTMTVSVDTDKLSFDISSYQNEYVVTTDELQPDDIVNDLILLYPQPGFNGNKSYNIYLKLESESFDTITETYQVKVHPIELDPIQRHIDFINENNPYPYDGISKNTFLTSMRNFYGQAARELYYDGEYRWSRISSFDFDNYDKIAFADLITNVLKVHSLSLPNLVPNYIKEWKSNFNSVRSLLNTMVYDKYDGVIDISETAVDKLLKSSKYIENGTHTEDVLYQSVIKLLGNADNAQRITKAFAAVDKTKQAVKFLKLEKNLLNDVLDCVNQITLFEAYSDADESFKKEVEVFYNNIPESDNKKREAVKDYLNYDAGFGGKIFEIVQTILDTKNSMDIDKFEALIGTKIGDLVCAKALEWIGAQTIAGTTIAETTAFATACTTAGAVFAGLSGGLLISEILCDSSTKSETMAKAITMGQYSTALLQTLVDAERSLYANRDEESLAQFEYAFSLWKSAQCYIVENMIAAMDAKASSLLSKIRGESKSMQDEIRFATEWKNLVSKMVCHSSIQTPGNREEKTKIIAVLCPVDVFVYDSGANEIVRIVNDEISYLDEGIICYIIDNQKYILVPDTEDYEIIISATDDGEMDYSVSEFDAEGNCTKYGKTNIPLSSGQMFGGSIPKGNADSPRDYNLRTKGMEIVSEPLHTALFMIDETVFDSIEFTVNETITVPKTPIKDGWSFNGWTPEIPTVMPDSDITFSAMFKNDDISEPVDNPMIDNFTIKNYRATFSAKYKSTLIFHTEEEAPAGYKIVWSNGQEGSECKFTATQSEYKISAKLVNAVTGETVQTTDEVTITVNTGFFARLIAFFRTLFRSLPVYEDFKKK